MTAKLLQFSLVINRFIWQNFTKSGQDPLALQAPTLSYFGLSENGCEARVRTRWLVELQGMRGLWNCWGTIPDQWNTGRMGASHYLQSREGAGVMHAGVPRRQQHFPDQLRELAR